MSKLYFKYGPMESGKSAKLLMEAHGFMNRGIETICMKPYLDDRYGKDIIKSRIGLQLPCFVIYRHEDLYKTISDFIHDLDDTKVKWVLIDEAQFLTKEQVLQLRFAVDRLNVNVICYGIRTDFQTNVFEGSKRLFELADDIEEMKISCSCGRKAIFNARFNEIGQLVVNGEQVLIGGEDIYTPMCSKCYYELLEKQNKIM